MVAGGFAVGVGLHHGVACAPVLPDPLAPRLALDRRCGVFLAALEPSLPGTNVMPLAFLFAAFTLVLDLLHAATRSRRDLAVEVVAQRQQVRMYQRQATRAPMLSWLQSPGATRRLSPRDGGLLGQHRCCWEKSADVSWKGFPGCSLGAPGQYVRGLYKSTSHHKESPNSISTAVAITGAGRVYGLPGDAPAGLFKVGRVIAPRTGQSSGGSSPGAWPSQHHLSMIRPRVARVRLP
jgi:hypothetical protein